MSVNQHLNSEIYDVVIIGAGAAGITLSLQLGQAGVKTALIEGGGFNISAQSQDLYKGFNEGLPYSLESQRLRFFGGTTNHWSGWCRPLAPETFVSRPRIDYPGWDIERSELNPYLAEALEILEVDPSSPWEPPQNQQQSIFNQALSRSEFKEVYWHWSPPTRFKQKYRLQLEQYPHLTISVKDSLIDFEFEPDGKITGAILQNIETNEKRVVFGKLFVMACGAIENARLLLHINAKNNVYFGNQSELLGKNFMEHPHIFDVGKVVFFDPNYTHDTSGGLLAYRFFCPTDEVTREDRILRSVLRLRVFERQEEKQPILNELKQLTHMTLSNQLQVGNLDITSEQIPSVMNTITLSEETDRLGIQKPVLNWELTDIDYKSLRVTLIRFAHLLADANIGRCKLVPWVLDETEQPYVMGGGHHMGTTRMASHASEGVVDTNCQLFGTKNLYIAGSSVFTTGGYANPTLTIVQLALRLAEHLKRQLT